MGGEQESVDRIFTGQISGFLNGNLDGTANNNIQYGFESSCPEGLDQNTALLATAAAIGETSILLLATPSFFGRTIQRDNSGIYPGKKGGGGYFSIPHRKFLSAV